MNLSQEYFDELQNISKEFLDPMVKRLSNDEIIPHSEWYAGYTSTDQLLKKSRLNADSRYFTLSLLHTLTNFPLELILNHLEHCATRHYIYGALSMRDDQHIAHMGLSQSTNNSLDRTCYFSNSTDSVLANLPPCCLEAIYQEAEKKLPEGQSAELIIGYTSPLTHVHSLGREKNRIVLSEVPLQQSSLSSNFSEFHLYSPTEAIEFSKKILKMSGYVWNDGTVIRLNSCIKLDLVQYIGAYGPRYIH
ncbi:MAG: hypothetical protein NMNS01_11200 [Nitrosomonas sp.]|nr:MAG: hypothetical protein NMNS01_11200 [Nitrosomonas sp.]